MITPAPASAQTAGGEAAGAPQGRFRLGPLRFTPSIVLSSLGVDDNVFSEAEDPKRDKTAVFGPAVDLWMPVGRSQLTGRVSGEYMYFQTYTNQRGLNTSDNLRWETRIGRVFPFLRGVYSNNKSRPGFEIQSRVRQVAQTVTLGSEIRFSGRTSVILSGSRSRAKYLDDAEFQGVDLAAALNGTTNSEEAELRYRLTTLTTFVANAAAMQDRFDTQRLRNSNSLRVLPGFELKKAALISGNIAVGFRRVASLAPNVPNFQGLVANVDAKTVIRSRTQIGVTVGRDVAFSYQEDRPYYLLTNTVLSITERIGSTWDIVAHGGRQVLDYTAIRAAIPAGVLIEGALPLEAPVADQKDIIRQWGGGFGYRFGRIMRLGIDASYYKRSSTLAAFHEYDGLRVGATVSYGLPQ